MSPDVHQPVMTEELIVGISARPGGKYLDCTVGSGGHALAVLKASVPDGYLLGLDLDASALEVAELMLRPFDGFFSLANATYAQLESVCKEHHFDNLDGVYMDLGVSSMQLESSSRGFTFWDDQPLDMRFGDSLKLTAADIVNQYSEKDLAKVIYEYGEEWRSRSIARRIVAHRPIETTGQLVRIVDQVYGGTRRRKHPATKTFQALRIEVNQELENLGQGLRQALQVLRPGGRLAVLSYHSLEDRIVKQWFQQESVDCICPPDLPVCSCNHQAKLQILNRQVGVPCPEEVEKNPRSRSAKLRIAQKI